MRFYRAVSNQELQDIKTTGVLRSGPPSFQGKWFAENVQDAAAWGRMLFAFFKQPFHIIEVEVPANEADQWFRLDSLDAIGPVRFAEIVQLPGINFLRECSAIPLGMP